jgi:hypothetical protein
MEEGRRTQNVPSGPAENSGERPLQSWKEIAAYLERDERTAQRWEKEEGGSPSGGTEKAAGEACMPTHTNWMLGVWLGNPNPGSQNC